MTYPLLGALFFVSVALVLALILVLVLVAVRWRVTAFWRARRRTILWFYVFWFGGYAAFIVFGTGPDDLGSYPAARSSPYELPWRAGATHWVGQGNRSFTSHRGSHLHAWDFWMPVGTEVVAARDGDVVDLADQWDGIGLNSNFVTIEHDDGTRAVYAHIRHGGAVVKVHQQVRQGQLIAYSGMVGQTLNPHLHFVVQNRDGSASLPISFADVPNTGVPLAGHTYASGNIER